MLKRLSLLFVVLFLFSSLAEAFHHHSDGADHLDCPICFATHHQSDTGFALPCHDIQRDITETPYLRHATDYIAETFFTPANNRAPPA